jgi:transposase
MIDIEKLVCYHTSVNKDLRNQLIYKSVEEGNTIRDTAKVFGVAEVTVDRVIRKLGYTNTKGKKMEEIDSNIEEIQTRLLAGESYRKLANKYGYAYGTFRHGVKKALGYLPESTRGDYRVNHTFVEKWSPELEYLFGAVASDGTLTNHGVSVRIIQKEIEWLELLGNLIYEKGMSPIIYTSGRTPILQISSRALYEKLLENGISQNKAHTIIVSEHLSKSVYFWRGYFEGDGGVSISSKQIYAKLTSCSRMILTQYRDFLLTRGVEAVGNVNKNYLDSLRVDIRGRNSLKQLFNLLYSDRLDLIHYRKYKNFKDMVDRL